MATQYTTLKIGEKDRYAHSWAAYTAAGATADQSDWTVTPGAGLNVTSEQNANGVTSALAYAITAGTYRLKNTVDFSDGSVGIEEIVFHVPALVPADTSYLSVDLAEERLWANYGLKGVPNLGDLQAASQELDDMRHRLQGDQYDPETQVLQFPRTTTVPGDAEGVVPERILDWVALRALQLSKADQPPAIEETVDTLSVKYTRGKQDRLERLMRNLIRAYLSASGAVKIVA